MPSLLPPVVPIISAISPAVASHAPVPYSADAEWRAGVAFAPCSCWAPPLAVLLLLACGVLLHGEQTIPLLLPTTSIHVSQLASQGLAGHLEFACLLLPVLNATGLSEFLKGCLCQEYCIVPDARCLQACCCITKTSSCFTSHAMIMLVSKTVCRACRTPSEEAQQSIQDCRGLFLFRLIVVTSQPIVDYRELS